MSTLTLTRQGGLKDAYQSEGRALSQEKGEALDCIHNGLAGPYL